jgi:hypothetical protein
MLFVGIEAWAALTDDIVLYYSFSEGKGDTVKDSSKYGNDGAINGTAKWANGKNDGAIELDGSKMAIKVLPSDSLTKLKEPLTVGAIFQPIAFPVDWQCLAEMPSTAADRSKGWKLGFNAQNPLFTTYGIADHIADKIVLEAGKWYYLVCVFDNKNASFYVDGELQQQVPASPGIVVSNSPGINIGAEGGTVGNWYCQVILDEFWISNATKSVNEIKQLGSPALLLSVNTNEKLVTTWAKIKSR